MLVIQPMANNIDTDDIVQSSCLQVLIFGVCVRRLECLPSGPGERYVSLFVCGTVVGAIDIL